MPTMYRAFRSSASWQLARTQLQIPGSIAFIDHHLFAVVRPAFRVRIGLQQFSHLRRRALHPKKLNIVPRISLVNRRAGYDAPVEHLQMLPDVLGSRARINGGVSSTIGGTGEGIVTIRCALIYARGPPNVPRKASSSLSAAG